ncbi:hypothetical protein CBR_g9128 [Chara braunii]|uniref:Uncharacterized protein n=1 Tax=Chara braunii TaxID=69332 RepID=A0A388KNV7_CHABU|nr:hypothetical protein CBR_g9128 [Chara braunii]|eukprot:GBG71717.1 hypothetical protein CBR_g9128 [Chara braunii]
MLVVFVVDTSASMNQRAFSGLSLLDCAKSAVEHFHKVRQRDVSSRVDRYMLVTCEEGDAALKVLDKYPFTCFLKVLKGIQARDLTNTEASMQRIFDFLHLQRLALGCDTYGQGRYAYTIDPTMIILLTDGTELTSMVGVSNSLVLSSSGPKPIGADLSSQPFRWDQRVFATVLRIPAVSSLPSERSATLPHHQAFSGSQSPVPLESTIQRICEYTGGKCIVVSSWKMLMQQIEMMAARLQPGVVASFEHIPLQGDDPLPAQVQMLCQRKIMCISRGQSQGPGHWPIPESYWPDPTQARLPPRDPHPVIAYKSVDSESFPHIPANFPCDKYEIEPTPIFGFMSKAPAGACWDVYIRNSKGPNNGYGDPFGYLKLNRVGSTLTLWVLPYNYPQLWQLLDQLSRMPATAKQSPPLSWRQELERYCAGIPPYYAGPLRAALKRSGLSPHIVPDSMDAGILNGYVAQQLKRMKAQAKLEVDRELGRMLADQQAAFGNVGSGAIPSRTSLNSNQTAVPAVQPPQEMQPGFGFTRPVGVLGAPTKDNTAGAAGSSPLPASTSASGNQGSSGVNGVGGGSGGSYVGLGPADSMWGAGVGRSGADGLERLVSTGPSTGMGAGTPAVFVSGPGLGAGAECAAVAVARDSALMKEVAVFRNAFDIPRDQLLKQLLFLPVRVAMALDAKRSKRGDGDTSRRGSRGGIGALAAQLAAQHEEEARHAVPIEKMGDFNEALMRQQPPRNPFVFAEDMERGKVPRLPFQSPYQQGQAEGPDEAWESLQNPSSPNQRGNRKRKRRPGSPAPPPPPVSPPPPCQQPNAPSGVPPKNVSAPESAVSSGSEGHAITAVGRKPLEVASDALSNREQSGFGRERPGESSACPSQLSTAPHDAIEDHPAGGGDEQPQLAHSNGDHNSKGKTAVREEGVRPVMPTKRGREGGDGSWPVQPNAGDSVREERGWGGYDVTVQHAWRDREEVVEFLLKINRVLKGLRGKDYNPLFSLLSVPVFPVDKANFVKQLVLQAQRHKKYALAEELSDYLSKTVAAGA